jgi:hypothetical protein
MSQRARAIGPDERWPGFIFMSDGRLRKKRDLDPARCKCKASYSYYRETTCSFCNKPMLQISPSRNNPACSMTCQVKKRDALAKQPEYKRRHAPFHPRTGRGYTAVPEHTLIAEEKLGRYLHQDEVVHHINMVKRDNRTENLFVCSSRKEHVAIHGSLNHCVAHLLEMGVLEFDQETRTYEIRI